MHFCYVVATRKVFLRLRLEKDTARKSACDWFMTDIPLRSELVLGSNEARPRQLAAA